MNNKILIGVILVAIVLILGFVLLRNNATNKQSVTQEQTSAPAGRDDMRPRETTTVKLTSSGFSPQTITIKPDTAIAFVNESGEMAAIDSDPHPVHTSYEPLNLGNFANGETLKLVFAEAGTYKYHNHLNPSQTGTVVVE